MRYSFLFILFLILIPMTAHSQTMADYLILQDIPPYMISTPRKVFIGGQLMGGPKTLDNSGVLKGTGHFKDHTDTTYKVGYLGDAGLPSPDVTITQHAGAESDKWILHEVEGSFRSKELAVKLSESSTIREIDGNKIFDWGYEHYRWISGNVVVDIKYADFEGTKPEPIEVVKAYLRKFPSTITMTDAEAQSRAHTEKWLRDEMERRLWLCDKWFAHFDAGKAKQSDALWNVSDSMEDFLKYREKYYGVAAGSDSRLMYEYKKKEITDVAALRDKLAEYKSWWTSNKGNVLKNLP